MNDKTASHQLPHHKEKQEEAPKKVLLLLHYSTMVHVLKK